MPCHVKRKARRRHYSPIIAESYYKCEIRRQKWPIELSLLKQD